MADADILVTAGTGTKVDTRTVGAGTDEHRQVVVVGDPTTAANVAAVSAAGRVSVDASGLAVPVTDNAGSLTVDSPVGTPTFVRLSDGAAAIATLPVSGTFFQATQPVSGTVTADTEMPAAAALADGAANPTTPLVGSPMLVFNGTTWDRVRGNSTIGQQIAHMPATLVISTTGIAAAAVTATLPAAGVGLFHYIARINIIKYATVATVGGTTPTIVTSTNLPGSLAWTCPTALAVGTQYETDVQLTAPLKSSVANTATTIVAPALASIIWRVNVFYYAAP